MIREVLIDGQQVDIDSESVEGYLLTSPIFRDISKISSNRTTAYKIPMTGRNAGIFKLYEQPDIISDYARQWHDFEEWHDGFLFIKGICRIVEAADGYYTMAVLWGNAVRLIASKNKKLREMDITETLTWKASTNFLTSEGNAGAGFLKVDYGQGVDNIRLSRPCIKLTKILDYIKRSQKIDFRYPERFNELFNSIWFPMLEDNAGQATWREISTTFVTIKKAAKLGYNDTNLYVFMTYNSGNSGVISTPIGISDPEEPIKIIASPVEIKTFSPVIVKVKASNIDISDTKVRFAVGDRYQEFPIQATDNGYQATCNINLKVANSGFNVPAFQLVKGEESHTLLDVSALSVTPNNYYGFQVQGQKPTVSFGDPYPIVNNLPDMKIIDFIKAIMNMFGLFTYYRQQRRENDVDILEFISMDDMYSNIPKSYNWTNKVIEDSKKKVTSMYGDYAQRNFMRYKENDEVQDSPDGYIDIEDRTLPDTKDLFTLPFAASNNVSDRFGNTYAKINIFDKDGKARTTTPRILEQNRYRVDNGEGKYISAHFPQKFRFGGETGLISKYYAQYQHILRKPLTMHTKVYLNSADRATLDERLPVFIDGVHYMPTDWDIYPDGETECLLLRMPPL